MSVKNTGNTSIAQPDAPFCVLLAHGNLWATVLLNDLDGYHILVYKADEGDSNFALNATFDDYYFASIAEDADSRLWLALINNSTGFVEVWRSNNGNGTDWTLLSTLVGAGAGYYVYTGTYGPTTIIACHLTDKDTVVISGISNDTNTPMAAGTTDGGDTWNEVELPTTGFSFMLSGPGNPIFTKTGRVIVSIEYADGSVVDNHSSAYSDDYITWTESPILPSLYLDTFGFQIRMCTDTDGNVYTAFGTQIKSSGQHCFLWDPPVDGVAPCIDNDFVYEFAAIVAISEDDGVTWSELHRWEVPEATNWGFDESQNTGEETKHAYYNDWYVPGYPSGIIHDGSKLWVSFESGGRNPVTPNELAGSDNTGPRLTPLWSYNGSTWQEESEALSTMAPSHGHPVIKTGCLSIIGRA